MKVSSNITDAQINYPEMYHIVNSNEVHSFETLDEAMEDLDCSIDAEKKLNTGFVPELFY